jgi:serine/threonine-protein kinase RsbW
MYMGTIRQSFESTLDSAYAIEDLVLDAARKAGFQGSSLDHISLAVHETAVNAILHGNQNSKEKKVEVEVVTNCERLRVKIGDEGTGFDPDAVVREEGMADLLRSSGRGVSLTRQIMDEYEVRPRPSGGAEVTLTKYLARSDVPRFSLT